MQWIPGLPNAPGWWVVEQVNRDRLLIRVYIDVDDETAQEYFRVDDEGFTEPLDAPDSDLSRFAARSFGPISEPDGSSTPRA